MITPRPAQERGHAHHGWLDSHHSFSFAHYFDPRQLHFSELRVINEDRVAPGQGFGQHGHRDMEILTYVLDGELSHRDTLGHGTTLGAGQVQLLSAGTGVQHSEFNASATQPVHFLQIWLTPREAELEPRYQEATFDAAEKRGRLRAIVTPDGRDGSLMIQQDAAVHAGLIDGDERAELSLEPGRRGYVHVARGRVTVNGRPLGAGDALKLQQETRVTLEDGERAEVLVFDLP